jgi:hypothetical protein
MLSFIFHIESLADISSYLRGLRITPFMETGRDYDAI